MIPEAYTLRFANDSDLPSIVAIYNSIIPSRMVTADLEPISVEARKPWMDAHNQATRPVWVLIENSSGLCAGWVSFDTFYARAAYDGTVMIALYLAEPFRKQGLGRILLNHAEEIAPQHGIHTILGYIFGHNAPSLKLFEHAGYERWGHLPAIALLDGVARDLIIMGKRCA